tara:strand:+ start:2736 stop:3053 length:318 start_codon:yes stop_codon:yes gene_type:complete
MSLDHDAIYKAYPNVVTIDDDTGAYDESGSIVNLDLSNIAAARVELDKLNYQHQRVLGIGTTSGYPDWREQMDMLYHDIKNGTLNTSGKWYVGITSVKTNIPKPS